MTREELKQVGERLTVEDLGELLAAFFHARNRAESLIVTVTARRLDTYSLLERLDLSGQPNPFALSL